MPKTIREHRWEPSAEVRAAARTRLPLRLPRPEETGLRLVSDHHPACDAKSRPTAPSRRRLPTRPAERRANLPLTDAELESLAQRVLLQSGVSGFARLHVEVRERVATLYGTLPTEFERQLAVQLVRRINGLDRVDQEISVWEVQAANGPQQAVQTSGFRWPMWASVLLVSAALVAIVRWIMP